MSEAKVATRKVNGDSAELDFGSHGKLSFKASDIPEGNRAKAILAGVLNSVVNGYSQHREDAAAAFKAASERLAMIMKGEWPQRVAGTGRPSALDVAVAVRATARNLDVAKVKEVVMSFDKAKRTTFISTVKADPLTAAAFAAARAKKPTAKSKAAPDFGGI